MGVEINQRGLRELDRRSGDGVEVILLWSALTGSVVVAVKDERTETDLRIVVDPGDALDAFRHPYAYAHRGRDLSDTPDLAA